MLSAQEPLSQAIGGPAVKGAFGLSSLQRAQSEPLSVDVSFVGAANLPGTVAELQRDATVGRTLEFNDCGLPQSGTTEELYLALLHLPALSDDEFVELAEEFVLAFDVLFRQPSDLVERLMQSFTDHFCAQLARRDRTPRNVRVESVRSRTPPPTRAASESRDLSRSSKHSRRLSITSEQHWSGSCTSSAMALLISSKSSQAMAAAAPRRLNGSDRAATLASNVRLSRSALPSSAIAALISANTSNTSNSSSSSDNASTNASTNASNSDSKRATPMPGSVSMAAPFLRVSEGSGLVKPTLNTAALLNSGHSLYAASPRGLAAHLVERSVMSPRSIVAAAPLHELPAVPFEPSPRPAAAPLFTESHARVLYLLESFVDWFGASVVAGNSRLVQLIAEFTDTVARMSAYKPHGLKLKALLNDALLMSKMDPSLCHLPVKATVGWLVARLLSSEFTAVDSRTGSFRLPAAEQWLATRLNCCATDARVLLKRSLAAAHIEPADSSASSSSPASSPLRDAHRDEDCTGLSPCGRYVARQSHPVHKLAGPVRVEFLLTHSPSAASLLEELLAEAIVRHDAELLAHLSALTDLSPASPTASMLAFAAWEQRLQRGIQRRLPDGLRFWLRVATICVRQYHDYQALFTVLGALGTAATATAAATADVDAAAQLFALTDSADDFRAYRNALVQIDPPAVPFVTLLLDDMRQVNSELILSTSAGPTASRVFDFHRVQLIARIRRFFAPFQSSVRLYAWKHSADACKRVLKGEF